MGSCSFTESSSGPSSLYFHRRGLNAVLQFSLGKCCSGTMACSWTKRAWNTRCCSWIFRSSNVAHTAARTTSRNHQQQHYKQQRRGTPHLHQSRHLLCTHDADGLRRRRSGQTSSDLEYRTPPPGQYIWSRTTAQQVCCHLIISCWWSVSWTDQAPTSQVLSSYRSMCTSKFITLSWYGAQANSSEYSIPILNLQFTTEIYTLHDINSFTIATAAAPERARAHTHTHTLCVSLSLAVVIS